MLYAYDVFNRRVRRDLDTNGDLNPESRELYVYDGDDVLLDFTDSDANGAALPALARRYLHGPAVDQVLAQENVGGETYWLLGDHLNSTHDLVRWDAAAGRTVVGGHQVYDAFGSPVDQNYLTRYQFTGREYDSATGQQYNRARWYSPHAGRWMSEDPLGFAAGDANLIRYVGNQPTLLVDPSGLKSPFLEIVQELVDRSVRHLYQIHHIVPSSVFNERDLGQWLTNIGFRANCAANLIALPNNAGRAAGVAGHASLHEGRHLDEYADMVRERLRQIQKEHSTGQITGDIAKSHVDTLVQDIREGLQNGTIALSQADRDRLASGEVLSIAGLVAVRQESTHDECMRITAPLTASHYFNTDSWGGWLSGLAIDSFNPVDTMIELMNLRHSLGLDKYDGGLDPETGLPPFPPYSF
ncbi:MAG: AHH domain-containing protein [Pirellulales bacterium]|nr:AHH domain-containing protein [Pirellulales bacterium]